MYTLQVRRIWVADLTLSTSPLPPRAVQRHGRKPGLGRCTQNLISDVLSVEQTLEL